MSKLKLVVLAIVALLMFVPFPVVVARSCEILVVDTVGRPRPDAEVRRGWDYGSPEAMEGKHTGPDGLARFDSRVERHSLFGRLWVNVASVVAVHGDTHIDDEYSVGFPDGYTADIDGVARFKWVDEPGHFAKIDLGGLPRSGHYRFKFTIREKTP